MEPTFFRTASSTQNAARQRNRRRIQALAALMVLALLCVAIYIAFAGQADKTPQPDPLAGQDAAAAGPATPADRAAVAPIPRDDAATRDARPAAAGALAPLPSPVTDVAAASNNVAVPPVTPPQVSPQVLRELADKLARAEALRGEKPVEARKLYAEVVDRGLPAASNDKVMQRLAELADQTLFSRVVLPGDPLAQMYKVPPGGVLARIGQRFSVRPELLQQINGLSDPRRLQADQSIKVIQGPFHAVVDKSDFVMTVYLELDENGQKLIVPVRRFKVGLGEYNSTPTGRWSIRDMAKFPAYVHPRTNKPIAADSADYPFGKLGMWIALKGEEGKAVDQSGYGIHSTNEPSSIGKASSLGCVRMADESIQEVWKLLRTGSSSVFIRE